MKINYLMSKPNTLVINLDLEKAFELCNKEVILESLVRKGVKGQILKWVKDFLQQRKARTQYQGHLSSVAEFQQRTPMGSALSPLLFNLVMERLLEVPHGDNVHLVSFADDLTIVVIGETCVEDARQLLTIIDDKCCELGLKINYKKTNSMKIKSNHSTHQLKIQNKGVKWVAQHKILGIQHHKSLTWDTHINYMMTKLRPRLNIMRSMTNIKLGLNYTVLRTFYIACMRSILDYAAITIIQAKDTIINRLEKFQNEALRIMFRAPPWAKLVNLRQEAGLVPVAVRVKQISAGFMCRALRSNRLEDLNGEVLQSLHQLNDPDGNHAAPTRLPTTTYAHRMAECLRDMGVTLQEAQTQDLPHQDYRAPPPWEETPIEIYLTTTKEKQRLTESDTHDILGKVKTIEQRPGQQVYYTDGSVHNESATAACSFVTSNATATYRLSDGASTMQTELVAILKALQHAHLCGSSGSDVTIITDSLSAVSILQRSEIRDNYQVTTSIAQCLLQLKQQPRRVKLVWVPSHIGVPGNEAADEAAKEGLSLPRVTLPVPASLSTLLAKTRHAAIAVTASQHRAEVLRHSPSATWYLHATGLQPPHVPPTMPRRLATSIHRLRLGFPCWETICGEARVCEHCEDLTEQPLEHYILRCPRTERLRATVRNQYNPAGAAGATGATEVADNRTEDEETSRTAAILTRQLLNCQESLQYLQILPPPR